MERIRGAIPGRMAIVALTVLLFLSGLAGRRVSAQEGITLNESVQLLNKLKGGEVTLIDKQCGLSCLYLFLKLHGVDAKFADIQKIVPIGEQGATLHDLSEASGKFGVRALPVRCAPANLTAVRLPAIAHLEVFGEPYPYLHYVVITRVGESDMTVFDPYDNEIHTVRRSDIGASLSGHLLIAAPWRVISVRNLLAVAGLLLTVGGTWHCVRAWRRARQGGGNAGVLRLSSVCVFVAVSCGTPGCGPAGSAHSVAPDIAKRQRTGSIEAEKTDLDLGQLKWKSDAKGEFRFRNKTSVPVRLRLGPASCSCLKVEMQPKDVLPPGEEGSLVLYLATTDRLRAGKTEACVPLFAGAEEEPLKFCVKGFLDGIVFRDANYVVRPAHQSAGEIPPFHFEVVSHTRKDLAIVNVVCASFEELQDMHPEGSTRVDMNAAKGLSPVAADLDKINISPIQYQASESLYVSRVEVPMRLKDSAQAFGGKIIVEYVLGGETLQAATNLLVLGSDEK